jgi:hypothetical protein
MIVLFGTHPYVVVAPLKTWTESDGRLSCAMCDASPSFVFPRATAWQPTSIKCACGSSQLELHGTIEVDL